MNKSEENFIVKKNFLFLRNQRGDKKIGIRNVKNEIEMITSSKQELSEKDKQRLAFLESGVKVWEDYVKKQQNR